MTYLSKVEKFVKKKFSPGINIPDILLDFAKYLDSQQKTEGDKKVLKALFGSEGNEKIEELKKVVHPEQGEIKWPFAESLLEILNEERDKLNQLIKAYNENL